MNKCVMRVVVQHSLGEGQLHPLVQHTALSQRASQVAGQHVVPCRGLVAVNQIPQRAAGILISRIDISSICHDNGQRQLPVEGVVDATGLVGVPTKPKMNSFALAAPKTSKYYALRRCRVGQVNPLHLLHKLAGEGIGVHRHIHTPGQRVSLVIHDHLLALKLPKGQALGDCGVAASRSSAGHAKHRRHLVQLYSNLHLLGQEVSRQRVGLAEAGGNVVGQGQHHSGILRHVQTGRAHTSTSCIRAAQSKQVIHSGARRLPAHSILQQLIAGQIILRRASIAKSRLFYKCITPSSWQRHCRQLGVGASQSRHLELAYNVLQTVGRRNGENRGAASQVIEALHILGVLGSREGLLLAGLAVIVIQIHGLPGPAHLLRAAVSMGCHWYIFRAAI